MITNTIVIRNDGNLKQSQWHFLLMLDSHPSCIRLTLYRVMTRLSTRHKKWTTEAQWDAYDHRNNNNIENPSIPQEVEREARDYYCEVIKNLPLK